MNLFNKKPVQTFPWEENKEIPSHGDKVGCATKKDPVKYTGDKMIGIGTMHKSNSVPVFSSEEAQDIAKMRRN